MRTHSVPRRSSARLGFTLLEVLLTSLLAAIVLVALWSLSDIYMRLFVIAQRKIDETQLARGLTEHLFEDLAQVIQKKDDGSAMPFVPRPASTAPASSSSSTSSSLSDSRESSPRSRRPMAGVSSSSSTAGPPVMPFAVDPPQLPGILPAPAVGGLVGIATASSSLSSTGSSNSAVEKAASEHLVPRFGLFGTSQALRLIVLDTNPRTAREPAELAEVLPQPGSVRPPLAAELRTIEYTYVEPEESTGDSQQHPPGLVRREWAWETWVGLRMLNQKNSGSEDSSSMLPEDKLEWSVEDADDLEMDRLYHVPSIVGLEFQYYDGEDWVDEWDSLKEQKLPVLVEVVFQIDVTSAASAPSADRASSAVTASEDDEASTSSRGTTYRQTIHLPWSDSGTPPQQPEQTAPFTDFARAGPPRGGRQP